MSKMRTRKMWVLVDKDLDLEAQLYDQLDGGLCVTKPIPAHKWMKPVRVVVTIQEVRRAKAEEGTTQSSGDALRERVAPNV